jgi:hypothetical protein
MLYRNAGTASALIRRDAAHSKLCTCGVGWSVHRQAFVWQTQQFTVSCMDASHDAPFWPCSVPRTVFILVTTAVNMSVYA